MKAKRRSASPNGDFNDLTNARLYNVNLTSTDLTNANMTGASLVGTQIVDVGAIFCNTTMSDGSVDNSGC